MARGVCVGGGGPSTHTATTALATFSENSVTLTPAADVQSPPSTAAARLRRVAVWRTNVDGERRLIARTSAGGIGVLDGGVMPAVEGGEGSPTAAAWRSNGSSGVGVGMPILGGGNAIDVCVCGEVSWSAISGDAFMIALRLCGGT